jgi:hypothetical protein
MYGIYIKYTAPLSIRDAVDHVLSKFFTPRTRILSYSGLDELMGMERVRISRPDAWDFVGNNMAVIPRLTLDDFRGMRMCSW